MTSATKCLRGAFSVWRRHFRAYRKTWLVNCLPPLFEPIVYLLAFGVGLSPAIRELTYHGQHVDYPAFIAPSMVALAVVMQSYFEGAYLTYVRTRFERSWQAMLSGPLVLIDVFLGELMWGATRGIIGASATALVGILWGIYPWWAFAICLPAVVVSSLLFAACGMFTAGMIRSIDQVNVPTFLFIIPMVMICGTYFPRDGLPAAVRSVIAVIPYSSLVDLLRWHLALPEHPLLLIGWLAVCTVAAAILAYRALKRLLIL